MNDQTDPRDALVPAYAKLATCWLSLCRDAVDGQTLLAAAAMQKYVAQLIALRQPSTDSILLPCNFETYALCIEEILQQLLVQAAASSITKVSTILSVGLKRWYNLAEEVRPPHGLFAYTRTDWEQYKIRVSDIAKISTGPGRVQMRRIIVPFDEGKFSRLYIYKTDDGNPIKAVDARGIRPPECLKILKELDRSIRLGPENRRLHVLAEHQENSCGGHAERWVRVLDHFESRFHTRVHRKKSQVTQQESGVFCGFVNLGADDLERAYGNLTKYDDIFVVERNSDDRGAFGLAFYQEKEEYFSGMVYLDKDQIRSQMQKLDQLWTEAAK